MENLFKSIFTNGITYNAFFIIILISIVVGVLFSLICKYKSTSTKSFFIASSLLPMCVAMVIMLVNGNIGAGVAVAGAFSLVRFRSAQGSAKEICIIFIDMAIGLALGMGYIMYAIIFAIASLIVLFVLSNTKVFDYNNNLERNLKIVIPENVDYTNIFNDTFEKYLDEVKLDKAKLTNMGCMFSLNYTIKLKKGINEKEFIDELRIKNNNLEIVLSGNIYDEKEL